MYIPEEMKLNRFKAVAMPSARDYFKAQGFMPTSPNQYTGDEKAPMPQNKVDAMNDWIDYANQKAEEYEQSQNKEE